jgi:hypothetical protein
MSVIWFLALLASVLGGGILLVAAFMNSAPQTAATAAIGIGLAVIPYCFARAIEKMRGPRRESDIGD